MNDYTENSGWISVDGSWFEVPNMGHEEYAREKSSTSYELQSLGWIACSYDFANHYINYHERSDITDEAIATVCEWYDTNKVSEYQHCDEFEKLTNRITQ